MKKKKLWLTNLSENKHLKVASFLINNKGSILSFSEDLLKSVTRKGNINTFNLHEAYRN